MWSWVESVRLKYSFLQFDPTFTTEINKVGVSFVPEIKPDVPTRDWKQDSESEAKAVATILADPNPEDPPVTKAREAGPATGEVAGLVQMKQK